MNQLSLTFKARAMGHASAKLAADHAGQDWQEEALQHLRVYAMDNDQMQAYLVRIYAENRRLPKAPDARAWGHVMRKAAKLGLIEATGRYVATEDATSHGRPQMVWRSKVRL